MKSINIKKNALGNFKILNYEEQNSEYEGMVIITKLYVLG
jgi:hypothetical protein